MQGCTHTLVVWPLVKCDGSNIGLCKGKIAFRAVAVPEVVSARPPHWVWDADVMLESLLD